MALGRWLVARLGNGLAFVVIVAGGIIAGCALSAGDALEDRLNDKKRHPSQDATQKR